MPIQTIAGNMTKRIEAAGTTEVRRHLVAIGTDRRIVNVIVTRIAIDTRIGIDTTIAIDTRIGNDTTIAIDLRAAATVDQTTCRETIDAGVMTTKTLIRIAIAVNDHEVAAVRRIALEVVTIIDTRLVRDRRVGHQTDLHPTGYLKVHLRINNSRTTTFVFCEPVAAQRLSCRNPALRTRIRRMSLIEIGILTELIANIK